MTESNYEIETLFYKTLKKEEREHWFQCCVMISDGEKSKFIKEIWKQRYQKRGLLPGPRDRFLNAIFDMLYVNNLRKSGIGYRSLKKEVCRIGNDLMLNEYFQYTEEKRRILDLEYENVFQYFIQLCLEDRNYSSGIFHLREMEKGKVKQKLAKDIKTITQNVPEFFGYETLFLPLYKSAEAAYTACFTE